MSPKTNTADTTPPLAHLPKKSPAAETFHIHHDIELDQSPLNPLLANAAFTKQELHGTMREAPSGEVANCTAGSTRVAPVECPPGEVSLNRGCASWLAGLVPAMLATRFLEARLRCQRQLPAHLRERRR